MSDFPTPWASFGQAIEMVDGPEAITYCVREGCDASLGGNWGDTLIHHEDGSHTAVPWKGKPDPQPRLLADLQEHGYPQETKQEET